MTAPDTLTAASLAPEVVQAVHDALEATPSLAVKAPTAEAELTGPVRVEVRMGEHTWTMDQSRLVGGTDQGPSPVTAAMGTLAACQAMTYRIWAARMGIELREVHVVAQADFDARRLYGVDSGPRPGPMAIRIAVHLEGDHPERHAELRAAVDAHCPVLDLFAHPVELSTELA